MILSLHLSALGAQMPRARIHKVCSQPGEEVRPGTGLLELRVDLGGARDCPPLFFCRLVATERAIVRELRVAVNDIVEVGAGLLSLSTTHDEPLEAAPARAFRCTAIGIPAQGFSD
jgi:hypothetical protein